ncbi:hypothetical protein [Allomesorhizobium camelthorni]|uniref:Uncharacterized protein n=1 Tax=Allomesorhizobium camelthorni TaxID=475069 RepID=A0A6G4WGX1_9HYPH|nr:hypothetical protein [Mesorhizobium camelthorni]NGO53854.1 hypothetical protein [Mesorhizobium camelthorni]
MGEGTDTVRSCINWTLAAKVERLGLEGSATNGTGNALNNTLVGNSLNNVLNGGAGELGVGCRCRAARVAGAGNLNETGNARANTLVGNAASNSLSGDDGRGDLI